MGGTRGDLQCCETEGGSGPPHMCSFVEYGISILLHQTNTGDYGMVAE